MHSLQHIFLRFPLKRQQAWLYLLYALLPLNWVRAPVFGWTLQSLLIKTIQLLLLLLVLLHLLLVFQNLLRCILKYVGVRKTVLAHRPQEV